MALVIVGLFVLVATALVCFGPWLAVWLAHGGIDEWYRHRERIAEHKRRGPL